MAPSHARFEYWRDPDRTAAAWRGDAFTAGDLGHVDDDGYLFLDSRRDDLIISGGVNVYPAEVEAALRSHPAVRDAAVIGIPDERWGEAVHAVVVLQAAHVGCEAAMRDELVAWCRQQLASYKCPRSIAFSAALPLSAAGKVLKNQLRADARKALA